MKLQIGAILSEIAHAFLDNKNQKFKYFVISINTLKKCVLYSYQSNIKLNIGVTAQQCIHKPYTRKCSVQK